MNSLPFLPGCEDVLGFWDRSVIPKEKHGIVSKRADHLPTTKNRSVPQGSGVEMGTTRPFGGVVSLCESSKADDSLSTKLPPTKRQITMGGVLLNKT